MSALRVTPERVESTTDDNEPYHLGANATESERAFRGLSYRTLCGFDRNPTRPSRMEWELTPIEKCAVCCSLDGDFA